MLGSLEKLANAPVIIIAEGYATAATIKEACELPAVVSAFDSGNLKAVAKELNKKYPHKPIILAADDDKYLELSKGINPGKEKASEAAEAVNGFIVLPTFASSEQSSNPKQFSDFNDLANHSKLGFEGVIRQIKPTVEQIAKRYNRMRWSKNSNVIHIS